LPASIRTSIRHRWKAKRTTLFTKPFATGKLLAAARKQMVAPFAFVSVLAGTLLLLEVMSRLARLDGGPMNGMFRSGASRSAGGGSPECDMWGVNAAENPFYAACDRGFGLQHYWDDSRSQIKRCHTTCRSG
jgi:hypothetical protein